MQRFAGVFVYCAVVAVGALGSLASAGQSIDHSDFDALLKRYVDGKGLVDYKTWKEKDAKALDKYVDRLADAKLDGVSREEKLAFYMNAYNAITIKTVIDHYPVKSIKDISGAWNGQSWTVAGQKMSLDDIEHKTLRKMGEPRIHFAIVCASKGCVVLRNGAFTADKLEDQLEDQVQKCFTNPEKLKIDRESKVVHAIKIFDWFGEDFGASDTQRLTWIGKHVKDPADRKVCLDNDATLKFVDWDWALNER